MTNKLMTLSEALATGRPFKHKKWSSFLSKDTILDTNGAWIIDDDFFSPVWQLQEEEKPPMRVVRYKGILRDYSGMLQVNQRGLFNEDWEDCTSELAAALAPYIKKELNL